MVKLLEFKHKATPPLQAPDVVVENMLMEDAWMGATPDLTRLRYKGPQFVFMWDKCRDTDWLDRQGLKKNRDYLIETWNAVTQREYLPFENPSSNNRNYGAYLPRTINWWKVFGKTDEDNPILQELANTEPSPVAGRIFSMGLEAIRQLDAYYGNGATHIRSLVPVHTGRTESSDVMMCWVYFTNIQAISKYDPHEKIYKLSSGITPRSIWKSTSVGNSKNFFELTRSAIVG